MASNYESELAAVNEAIIAITGGAQSYSLTAPGGVTRSFTKASLPELYKRQNTLETIIDRRARGGMKVTYVR